MEDDTIAVALNLFGADSSITLEDLHNKWRVLCEALMRQSEDPEDFARLFGLLERECFNPLRDRILRQECQITRQRGAVVDIIV